MHFKNHMMESSAKNLLTTSIIAFAQLGYCENRHFAEAAKDAKIPAKAFYGCVRIQNIL